MAAPKPGSAAWKRAWTRAWENANPGKKLPPHAAFTPYKPPRPPAGSYDPSLDAQGAAASRGLRDLSEDVGTAGLRDTIDYGLQRGDIEQSRDRGFEDLGVQRQGFDRDFGRSSADLRTTRTRGEQDYQRNIQMLQRSYQQLGGRQQEQQNAVGVLRGGAALQAAQKRAENEALDRQPIDTSYQRFIADNDQAVGRLNEDRATGIAAFDRSGGRLTQDTDSAFGRLALQLAPPDASNPFGGRAFQDRSTQLARAGRENVAFGLDLDAQRYYQAGGAGWEPPGRGEAGGMPKNEFAGPNGPYRVIQRGAFNVRVDPSGRVIGRTRRRR